MPDTPQAGQPFRPSARQAIRTEAAAETLRRLEQTTGFDPERMARSQTVIMAYNGTSAAGGGGDLEQYDAVYVRNFGPWPHYGSYINENEFLQNSYVHLVNFPDPDNYKGTPVDFGITQEPIKKGAFGPVAVSGITICKLNETLSYGGEFAHLNEFNRSPLLVKDCWGVKLLWSDTADSPHYGVVRLDHTQMIRPFELKEVGTPNPRFYPLELPTANSASANTDTQFNDRMVMPLDRMAIHARPRDAASGTRGARGWAVQLHDEDTVFWQLLAIEQGVETAKVQSDAGVGNSVSVKRCSPSGTEYGAAFTVHCFVPAGRDLALWEDDLIGIMPYLAPDNHTSYFYICVSDCTDDKLGTIKWWSGTVATIPAGWTLCDGSSYGAGNTRDLSGRFIMCIDEDGGSGETALHGTGGYRWHGETENNHANHPTHPEHYHDIGAGQGAGTHIGSASTGYFTGGAVDSGGSGVSLTHDAHDGPTVDPDDSNKYNTDNRPRFYVLAAIQRTH